MLGPALAGSLVGFAPASAADELSRQHSMLVDVEHLAQAMASSSARVLDTRPRDEYARAHVPGALWVDVKAWQELSRRAGGMKDAKAWSSLVGQVLDSREGRVVVYGASPTDAARVWWTLQYLGVKDVALLDGGWKAWQQAGRPTRAGGPTGHRPAAFEPRFQPGRLEEIDPLKNKLAGAGTKVIDARSGAEFTGQEVRGKRGGHIAGATHLEWKELLRPDGRFKSREELRRLFAERGIQPDQTAVTC